MNKWLWSLLCVTLLGAAACSDDDTEGDSGNPIPPALSTENLPDAGLKFLYSALTPHTFTMNVDAPWEITKTAGWFVVTPNKGEAGQNIQVTVTPALNQGEARDGEFTIRAYLAGKLDLSQAEAVADIIASSSRASHALAANQMRGGYSEAFDTLREKLLHLTSLLELELDFSEEEVEFADRTQLRDTMRQIKERIDALRSSFSLGNAIKEGVAVAIVGAPNVGKSTLLNRLLNEERAMVSDIAGTTRDVIEERANIDGVVFRFLDTAGIRSTNDTLEQMGIARTMSSIERARIVIHMVDASTLTGPVPAPDFPLRPGQKLLTVVNKTDKAPAAWRLPEGVVGISAKHGEGIDALCDALRESVDTEALYHGDPVVSNSRHYEALSAAREALGQALDGLAHGLPTDLLSEEIRQVITHLGAITGRGAIAPDEILQNIFSKFCIGK